MAMRRVRLRTLMIAVSAVGLVLAVEAASRDLEAGDRRDLLVASCLIAVVGVPFAAGLLSSGLREPAPAPPVANSQAELLLQLFEPHPGRPPRDEPAKEEYDPDHLALLARWAIFLWLFEALVCAFMALCEAPGDDLHAPGDAADGAEGMLSALILLPGACLAAVATLSWVALHLIGHLGAARRCRHSPGAPEKP